MRLLAEAARVLGATDELDPVAIYAAANPPQVVPAVLADERFPLTLLPLEGFPKIAEFWGTMGETQPLEAVSLRRDHGGVARGAAARRADRHDHRHAHPAARPACNGEHALPHRRRGARRDDSVGSRLPWRGSNC